MGSIVKYKNSVRVRLILSYTLLALSLIGLFGGYLYSKADRMMIDEMSRSSKVSLDTIRDYVTLTFLPKFVETSRLMATITPDANRVAAYFLDNSYRDNSYLIPELNGYLRIATYANPGTQNITYYYLKDGIVVDANYFYETKERSPDQAFIAKLQATPMQEWIVRTARSEGEAGPRTSQVLTYVYSLPFKATGDQIKGYMYIDVDLGYLKVMLSDMVAPQLGEVHIYDGDLQPLVSTKAEAGAAGDAQELLPYANRGTAGFDIRENGAKRDVIAYSGRNMSADGFAYVVVRPIHSFLLASNKFKDDIVYTCLILLILGLASSFILTQRFYLPVKQILSYIRKQHAGYAMHQSRNEYTIINNVLHSLDSKLHEQARDGLVNDAIRGNGGDTADSKFIPGGCNCTAVVIRLNEGSSKTFGRLYTEQHVPVQYDLSSINPHELVILYYVPDDSPKKFEEVRNNLEMLRAHFAQEVSFAVGIGNSAATEEDIHRSYKQALQALKYTFVHGAQATIDYEQIGHVTGHAQPINYDVYQNALRAGDTDLVNQFLDEFSRELSKDKMQIEIIEFEIMQLITRLSQTIIELNLHDAVISSTDLFSEFKKSTLKETLQWLRDINREVLNYLHANAENPNYAIIRELKSYIDNHLDEVISLDLLAEKAHLSPSYISSLFAEIMHVPFSIYLTNARVDKAAELLCASTLSVTEIATAVGYSHIQYFCRRFKEKYGITPMQYRKAHNAVAFSGKATGGELV